MHCGVQVWYKFLLEPDKEITEIFNNICIEHARVCVIGIVNFRCFDPLLFQSTVTFQCSVFDLTPASCTTSTGVSVPRAWISPEYILLRECNNWEHCKNGSSIPGDYLISFQYNVAWWRHQMETFSVLLTLSAGNSPVTGEFPAQRPVTRSFGVFFDLRLNKRLSKQSWDCWFEMPPCSLWRHCNAAISCILYVNDDKFEFPYHHPVGLYLCWL